MGNLLKDGPPASKLPSVPDKQVASIATTGMTELEKLQAKAEQNPRDPDAHGWYGQALAQAGSLDAAIDQYRAAVKLPPKDIPRAYLYRDLGEALEKKGDLDGALVALRKCVVSWPTKNEPYCAGYEHAALGRVIEKKEGSAAALEYWKNLMTIARDPDQCRLKIDRLAAKTK